MDKSLIGEINHVATCNICRVQQYHEVTLEYHYTRRNEIVPNITRLLED
jgi:hypothetical protein